MAEREKLFERVKGIAEKVRERNNFFIVHHYDCDGLASAAVIVKALERAGKKVSGTKWLKQLYIEDFEEIKEEGKDNGAENYCFLDFGSLFLERMKEEFGENFFVIDHHQVKEGSDNEKHLNACTFGFSGNDEISSSGTVYLLAKELDEENKDLSALAIVGAAGDMQESRGNFEGLNKEILEDGISAGVLEVKKDLRLYGRVSRPLIQFLMYSSEPILPMLTANEANCAKFLQGLGIELKEGEHWRCYEDLKQEEKQKLVSGLMMQLMQFKVPEWKLQELIGEVYVLKKEMQKSPLSDVKEFATMLNACGRNERAELALKVCLGDREEAYSKALSLMAWHRMNLRKGIELMQEKGVEERENFYYFDSEGKIPDSIIGIVAGMLYGSGLISWNKPIIALARHQDGSIKASGRGTRELVRRGLNLGIAVREIAKELRQAEGGGHKVAAGIKFEEKDKEKFLKILDEKIKEQLHEKH